MLKKKKANIITENIIFLILNLTFITILILFLFSKTSNESVLEEKYAKKIALLLDAAEPGMIIFLDMKDAIDLAKKNGIKAEEIVKINKNIVTVKLSEDGGYSYSFFNNLDFGEKSNFYVNEEKTGFVFVIG
ncbi:MAG: hypothetical protein KatS3mg001_376 [Candidatus Pacearchaeota archaeon]|nr:MAG: hypothetical protein KatS3mg001_376 [Candidatus Pacearchaeota archaeon]